VSQLTLIDRLIRYLGFNQGLLCWIITGTQPRTHLEVLLRNGMGPDNDRDAVSFAEKCGEGRI
jgi:hypothetical protein